jgi:hypothetical protein
MPATVGSKEMPHQYTPQVVASQGSPGERVHPRLQAMLPCLRPCSRASRRHDTDTTDCTDGRDTQSVSSV